MPDMMTNLSNWGHYMGAGRGWEQWGGSGPYFGVCSDKEFRTDSMTTEPRAEFFGSGDARVSRILQGIERIAGTGFFPASILDFGCGVSCLVVPFAWRTERVVSVDISSSIIDEAKRNCSAAQVSGVEFVESDNGLNRIHGTFGLVHGAFIHRAAAHFLEEGAEHPSCLADHVASKGVLAVQILSGYDVSPVVRWMCGCDTLSLRRTGCAICFVTAYCSSRPCSCISMISMS